MAFLNLLMQVTGNLRGNGKEVLNQQLDQCIHDPFTDLSNADGLAKVKSKTVTI